MFFQFGNRLQQGKSRIFCFASGGYRGPPEFYIRCMKSSISGDSRRRVSSKRNIFEFLRSSASGPGEERSTDTDCCARCLLLIGAVKIKILIVFI